jgi:hypothetical protein
MYHHLKATYWWYGIKRDVADPKLSINVLLGCCNHCQCLNESGKRLPLILSWVCRELSRATIPFG